MQTRYRSWGMLVLALVGWQTSGCDGVSDAPAPGVGQTCSDERPCAAGLICYGGLCRQPAADEVGGDSGDTETSACVPQCAGLQCGPDGCGSSCGICANGSVCTIDQQCVQVRCQPDCASKQCGSDGCGSLCGTCPEDHFCNADQLCQAGICQPDCNGKACGDDGCGGICGLCPADYFCNGSQQCEFGPCQPDCDGKACGDDGCGGLCGSCLEGFFCNADQLCQPDTCQPDCAGKQCGDDGCGGACGTCADGYVCSDRQRCISDSCQPTTPASEGALVTDVAEIEFDAIAVTVEHKRDIDPWEDGCIVFVGLEFRLGDGCRLSIAAADRISAAGELQITSLHFAADSQCPGFPDEAEGEYDGIEGLTVAAIALEPSTVPGSNVAQSCLDADFELLLAGTLTTADGLQSLTLDGTVIRVSGTFVSQGQTTASCPCVTACDGRECGDDGCGGVCGQCPMGSQCVEGTCSCVPQCPAGSCGDDGCGSACSCAEGQMCLADQCITCPECGDAPVWVMVSWDTGTDFDLHVVQPSGEEIFYGHRQSVTGSGVLALDSNAGCSLDNVNRELVLWPADPLPEPGIYHVLLDLWSACDVTTATFYTVALRIGDNVQFFTGSIPAAQSNGGGQCCASQPIAGPEDCTPNDCTYVTSFELPSAL